MCKDTRFSFPSKTSLLTNWLSSHSGSLSSSLCPQHAGSPFSVCFTPLSSLSLLYHVLVLVQKQGLPLVPIFCFHALCAITHLFPIFSFVVTTGRPSVFAGSLWLKTVSVALLSLCMCFLSYLLFPSAEETLTKEHWVVLCSWEWTIGSVWICGWLYHAEIPGPSLVLIFCLKCFFTVNKSTQLSFAFESYVWFQTYDALLLSNMTHYSNRFYFLFRMPSI